MKIQDHRCFLRKKHYFQVQKAFQLYEKRVEENEKEF